MKNVLKTTQIALMSKSSHAEMITNPVIYNSPGFPYNSRKANIFNLGEWKGSIQLTPNHAPETMEKAQLLQAQMERIGGSTPIPIVAQNGGLGFKLGTYDEWNDVLPVVHNPYLKADDHYILISTGGTMRIFGKDQQSLENAIWHFLHILGYRQFFPTAKWEIVPEAINAFNVNIGLVGNNNFAATGILAGQKSANMQETKALIIDWMKKNRTYSDFVVDDHQMWKKVVLKYPQEFADNPQYNSSEGNKLCVMEPDVQEMVVQYMKDQVLFKPEKITYSITAPDGSIGWDESCENGGPVSEGGTGENSMSPSDRQVFIANIVQQAFREEALMNPLFEDKRAAFLAYGDTSLPLTLTLDSDVYVTVATAFVMGGQTPSQVADAYRARGAINIGYYGYVGTQLWGSGHPMRAKMSNQNSWNGLYNEIYNVTNNSPFPYTTGESSYAWGPYGLGFYIFSKILSDPYVDSTNVDVAITQHKDDFLTKSFGPAASKMEAFFDYITAGDGQIKILSTNLVHKMYDLLQQARAEIDVDVDVEIRDRINDFVIYTKILELQHITETASIAGSVKLDAYDDLAHFVFRTRDSAMYDYYNFFFDPTFHSMKAEMADKYNLSSYTPYTVRNDSGWDDSPVSDLEIQTIIASGLANNPPYPFTPIDYGIADLQTTTVFDEDPRERHGEGGQDNFKVVHEDHAWYLKTKTLQNSFTITAMAGSGTSGEPHINGNAIISLYKVDLFTGSEEFIDSFEVISDNVTVTTHTFSSLLEKTMYRLDIFDPSVMVHLKWNKDEYKIVHHLKENGIYHLRNNYSYFYVPKSNTNIGVYLGRAGSKVYRPDDTVAYTSSTDYEYVSVDILDPNHIGKPWKLYCRGTANAAQGCYLYNVPSQIARSPKELLIQQSLIEEDNLL